MDTDKQQQRERVKTRLRHIGIGAGGLLLGFLIGYIAQIGAVRSVEGTLADTRQELEATRSDLEFTSLQARVGAAMAEASRGNYERARQLMSSFYQAVEELAPTVTDPATRRAIALAVRDRDDMITLLSRAAPESAQRLTMLYSSTFVAFDGFGRQSPTMVTPPPDTTGQAADSTRRSVQ